MFAFFQSQRNRKNRRRFLPCLEELETRALPSTYVSTNWSGYFVENNVNSPAANAFTSVSASWVVPTISSSDTRHAYSSTWVGLDGANSATVEQIGTEQDTAFTSKADGTPQYYAWWEMYPNYSYEITGLAIHAGDSITASVTYSGSTFKLSIKDNTDAANNSFSTSQAMPAGTTALRSSAEWIMEAPSSYFGVLPLADFSTPVNFSNASATLSGNSTATPISAFPSTDIGSINMINNSYRTLDTTSALSGNGFTVTYTGPTSFGGGGGRHHHSPTTVQDVPVALQNTPAQTMQPSATVISVAHANGQTFVTSTITQNPQPPAFSGYLIVAPTSIDSTDAAPKKENQQGDGMKINPPTNSSGTSRLVDGPGGSMSRQALDEFFADPVNREQTSFEEVPALVGSTAPVIDVVTGAEISFLLLGAYLGNPTKAKETEDNTKRKVKWL